MKTPEPLHPTRLYRRCDPATLGFETTAELEEPEEMPGQARALEALRFGVSIRRHGYNIYALGPHGMGKHSLVRQVLEREAAGAPVPSDWCYVNNFREPDRPRALPLPAGRGRGFHDDMQRLVSELSNALPGAFETEEYQGRADEIRADLRARREEAFAALQAEAQRRGMTMIRTPGGIMFVPVRGGQVMEPCDFEGLPPEERQAIEATITGLQERLATVLRQMPQWLRETGERIRALNRDTAALAVGNLIDDLAQRYADVERVPGYLEEVKRDLVENVEVLLRHDEGGNVVMPAAEEDGFARYRVNLFVDHADDTRPPVIYEDAPLYSNIVGRVEHRARMGALVTDHTLIKAGALHRANGGYLVLDVRKILGEPFAWEGLKRALYAGEVRIQALARMYSLVSTVSLDPEPIPLDLKVVLLGDRLLYYLLHEYDPDFAELFKVEADFDEQVDLDAANRDLYARLVAGIVRREGLLPFDRTGVARVIEHGSRLAADAERLSTHLLSLKNLLYEADHRARAAGAGLVAAAHVQEAIDRATARADRVRERTFEEIGRGTIMIDTAGSAVAQVNGISVIQLGTFAFGQPSRITATARVGEGEVVDIEREVELGGAIHSKGVLILGAYLSSHYLPDRPLSLSASVVFEQSYVLVEGDSASMAELLALLSALAGVPVRQAIAITGSVNQLGQSQAIGGVNEKIEGFFDVCKARGLSGENGVIIPRANVKHLMLRRDIVEAAAQGLFRVWPVSTVDQAIELLTGMPAGEADASGRFPARTFNARVRRRLEHFAHIRHEFERPATTDEDWHDDPGDIT